jgi:hypothetical protein
MSHSSMLAARRKRQAGKKRLANEAKQEKKTRKASVEAATAKTKKAKA